MSDRVSTLTPTTNVTLGFTVLVEASDKPGMWYPPMTASLLADEDAAATERDQWVSVGRKAQVVRCVTPMSRELEPTEEDLCAGGGHVYAGDDGSGGRCYCGQRGYPPAGPVPGTREDLVATFRSILDEHDHPLTLAAARDPHGWDEIYRDAGLFATSPWDGPLIVAAVNALPGLLDELEAARALIAAMLPHAHAGPDSPMWEAFKDYQESREANG